MAAEVLFDARDDFDPMNKRSAELLYHQVERFQSLLSDLLEISRFDAGAAVLDAEPQDIFQVISHVMEGAAPVAAEYGSEVRLNARQKSIIVEMDSRRIDRILRNLLLNALEHGEGKPVHISVAANHEAVAVSVRDHGIGMTQAEAAGSSTASGGQILHAPGPPEEVAWAFPSQPRTPSFITVGFRLGGPKGFRFQLPTDASTAARRHHCEVSASAGTCGHRIPPRGGKRTANAGTGPGFRRDSAADSLCRRDAGA